MVALLFLEDAEVFYLLILVQVSSDHIRFPDLMEEGAVNGQFAVGISIRHANRAPMTSLEN